MASDSRSVELALRVSATLSTEKGLPWQTFSLLLWLEPCFPHGPPSFEQVLREDDRARADEGDTRHRAILG